MELKMIKLDPLPQYKLLGIIKESIVTEIMSGVWEEADGG